MGFVFALLMLTFVGVWGSIFLANALRTSNQQLGQDTDTLRLAHLQEETEMLAKRLEIVEDELRFFRELRAPEHPDRLPPPPTGSDPS